MRIISGKFRGLKLHEFDAENIRPTLDRAKEGIFNKIQFLINDADCLDLFGGTGAVSLEFVSRGANSVITVDKDKRSCDLINKNFALAGIKPNLKQGDYLEILKSLAGKKFDIIFLDPPFKSDCGLRAIEKIVELELLADSGVIIFEHSSDVNIDNVIDLHSLGLSNQSSKNYGYITADFIKASGSCE